jgi:pSer/pThr/pTyr-binding forkhead associated (FHA) protein
VAQRFRLRSVGSFEVDAVFELHRGDTTVGRGPDNRVLFDHPDVSRHHAVLTEDGTRLTIRDGHEGTPSGNGTLVNGREIDAVSGTELQPGDVIRFGSDQVETVVESANA